MFIRRKRSVQKSGEYEYLQIVESIRDGDKVRQKVIGTLGRADKVLASGKIDALISKSRSVCAPPESCRGISHTLYASHFLTGVGNCTGLWGPLGETGYAGSPQALGREAQVRV